MISENENITETREMRKPPDEQKRCGRTILNRWMGERDSGSVDEILGTIFWRSVGRLTLIAFSCFATKCLANETIRQRIIVNLILLPPNYTRQTNYATN